MRAIWTGTISFVLVNIPVRLYTAIEHEEFDFDLLHKKDLSHIRYARVCKNEEKEVPYEEITKGVEYESGKYVIVTPEDFKKADPKKSKSIEILDFVQKDEVDPIYFDRPYFLEPEEAAKKSFSLFVKALTQTGKVAIAKFMLREREHLAMIRPYDSGIILQHLRFAQELRNPKNLNVKAETEPGEKELNLAKELINQMSGKFDPSKYKDTHAQILSRIIKSKAKGMLIQPVSKEPSVTEFEDLMGKLKESLEHSK